MGRTTIKTKAASLGLKSKINQSTRETGFHQGDVWPAIQKSVFSIPGVGRKPHVEGGILMGYPRQRFLLFIGDLLLIVLANVLGTWLRLGVPHSSFLTYTTAFLFTLIIYPTVFYVFDLYNIEKTHDWKEMVFRSGIATAIGGILSILLFYLLPESQYGRGIMAIQMSITWIVINVWRGFFASLYRSSSHKIPTLILGAGYCGDTLYRLLESPLSPYEIKGFLDDDPLKLGRRRSPAVLGACSQLKEIAEKVGAEMAILAIPKNRSATLIRNILEARLHGIVIKEMADIHEQLTGRIPVQYIADQWLLFAEGFYLLHKEYIQKLKRLCDLILSGIMLMVTAPLFGLIALAIRLDTPGPIVYRQERVGKNEKVFTIYKFRSMSHDAEKGKARWAAERDPRVTRVGRLLRLSHMDELPQVWNVFKGEMSIVGPRPERPEFVALLEQKVPYYFVRHSVRPGITGWAQVNYRYGSSIEDASRKLESDLYYVKNMSLLLDFKILLKTIGVVLFGEGAR